jgi:hypothetical protein
VNFRPCVSVHQLLSLNYAVLQGLDLVFVAVYQSMLTFPFVDSLLTALRDEFAKIYRPGVQEYRSFDATYKRLLERAEAPAVQGRTKARMIPMCGNKQVC